MYKTDSTFQQTSRGLYRPNFFYEEDFLFAFQYVSHRYEDQNNFSEMPPFKTENLSVSKVHMSLETVNYALKSFTIKVITA